jgi:thiol-disulfide isomerase/thioredoxin
MPCCGARRRHSTSRMNDVQTLKDKWRKFRARYWLALGFDLVALVLVIWGIHLWQIRDLPLGEPSPPTVLPLLANSEMQTAVHTGTAGVVYFFAPWCAVCKHSIGNLDQQVQDGSIAWATAVALDFTNEAEVTEFVNDTEITLPVLLGSSATAEDWNIRAFPTYFMIDASGNIHSRAVGYSTSLGIRWRNWWAQVRSGS